VAISRPSICRNRRQHLWVSRVPAGDAAKSFMRSEAVPACAGVAGAAAVAGVDELLGLDSPAVNCSAS
jgi:hypothetical protein